MGGGRAHHGRGYTTNGLLSAVQRPFLLSVAQLLPVAKGADAPAIAAPEVTEDTGAADKDTKADADVMSVKTEADVATPNVKTDADVVGATHDSSTLQIKDNKTNADVMDAVETDADVIKPNVKTCWHYER